MLRGRSGYHYRRRIDAVQDFILMASEDMSDCLLETILGEVRHAYPPEAVGNGPFMHVNRFVEDRFVAHISLR